MTSTPSPSELMDHIFQQIADGTVNGAGSDRIVLTWTQARVVLAAIETARSQTLLLSQRESEIERLKGLYEISVQAQVEYHEDKVAAEARLQQAVEGISHIRDTSNFYKVFATNLLAAIQGDSQ
jgi:hypothetical protein